MTVVSASYANYRRPASVTYADGGGTTTQAFSFAQAVNLGAVPSSKTTRTMIVMLNSQAAGGGAAGMSSVDLGFGNGMTRQDFYSLGTESWETWNVTLNSGTSGTLTLNHAAGVGFSYVGFVMWAVYGLTSLAVSDAQGNTGSGNPISRTCAVPFQGVMLAAAFWAAANTFTWTDDVTEDSDITFGGSSFRISAASMDKQFNAGTRAGNYTATSSGSTTRECYATSFR